MAAIIGEQLEEMAAIIGDESNRRDDRKSQGMTAIIGDGQQSSTLATIIDDDDDGMTLAIIGMEIIKNASNDRRLLQQSV